MGLFILPRDDSLEAQIESAKLNIELFLEESKRKDGYEYLLQQFALTQLEKVLADIRRTNHGN